MRARLFAYAAELFPAEVEASLKKYRRANPGYVPPDFDVRAASRAESFDLVDGVLHLKDAPGEPWLRSA